MKKRFLMIITIACLFITVIASSTVYAASGCSCPGAHKGYWKNKTVYKAEFIKDEYTPWKAQNVIFQARRNGETASFSVSKSIRITTTGEISLSVPIKDVEAKLGISISKSRTSTLYGSNSAPLEKGEMCRHYYREHYKVYKVIEKWQYYCKDCRKITQTKYVTKTIKVPQAISSKDYGWRYSKAKSKLPNKLTQNEKLGRA